MLGQMYSSSEDALRAFQSKNLLGKIIVFDESNPSEKDIDAATELYKVLCMAQYLMWIEIGTLRLIPLKSNALSDLFQNGDSVRFKVGVEKNGFGLLEWIIEANTPLDLTSMIDAIVRKHQLMVERYSSLYGINATDLLSNKLAGTFNRHMPIFHASIYGKWIATDIEGDYWTRLTGRVSNDSALLRPSYTVDFNGINGCSFGGEHPFALNATGIYDSTYNIVVSNDGATVLAFVVSNEDDTLKIILRYYNGANGSLCKRDDNDLPILICERISTLK